MAKLLALQRYTPLSESNPHPSEPETGGGRVFRGVTIIRSGLGNKRDKNFYPGPVLKEAAREGLFEGLRAYADHQTTVDEEIQPERSIRDIVGVYENTKFVESGGGRVTGDLRILKAHKWLSDVIDELVQIKRADLVGISINGRGQTEPTRMKLEESGEEVEVNELKRFIQLRSADVVTEAGAGGGFQQLLESARTSAAKETTTMTKQEFASALSAAAEAQDFERVQALAAQLAEAETEADEAEADEAEEAEAEAEETEDDELESAVEEAKAMAVKLVAEEPEDAEEPCDEETEDCEDMAEAVTVATKGRGIKGIPTGNTGTALKRGIPGKGKKNAGKGFPGVKTVEVGAAEELVAEIARLRAKVGKLASRNERLAEALRIRASADRARKLLKESGIPESLSASLFPRLIGKSEQEMANEIKFTQRLMESVREDSSVGLDTYEEVEGAGTRMRESYAGEGDEVASVLRQVGLPLKG